MRCCDILTAKEQGITWASKNLGYSAGLCDEWHKNRDEWDDWDEWNVTETAETSHPMMALSCSLSTLYRIYTQFFQTN